MLRARVLPIALVALLLVGSFPAVAQDTGRLLRFPLTMFEDTLFTSVDVPTRVAFDEDGDLWYGSPGGLVRIDVDSDLRELWTRIDGLPSSYTLGVTTLGGKVYAATDLGVGILDRRTGEMTNLTPLNSELPDALVREVVADGADIWIGTHSGGVSKYNTTTGEWTHKNTSTTASYAKPVRRVVPADDHVWVTTDGDGAWRMDRKTGAWSVLLKIDGMPSNTVLAALERPDGVWLGTDKGLVHWKDGKFKTYDKTHGMPDERVHDLDDVPVEGGGFDIFASTREGVWQLHPENGANATRAQSFGILGSFVVDQVYDAEKGWVFATARGLSFLRDQSWKYFTTGPSTGPSMGPLATRFTAVSNCASTPFLWFGADAGVTALLPAHGDARGAWYNFGEWARYPGGPVNFIDCEGNTTWFATNSGVFGYDVAENRWVDLPAANSRNLVYGIAVDRDELWAPLFGEGLVMKDLKTGLQRSWTYQTVPAIPDQFLTDIQLTASDVYLGASVGVIRMDRTSGTFTHTYTVADGMPGRGVVFRVLPDAGVVWVGMKEGGLAKLDVGQGRVTQVWNATTSPGFPDAEVRSLHREGGRLWVGTKEGLVRLDVATGATTHYNQSNSPLVQNFVNGIGSMDGIVYFATGSGIARFDVTTMSFLPMRDGPDAQRGGDGSSRNASLANPVSVRIESPSDGHGVTGAVEVRGTASRFGGKIDLVEVRIGDGPWLAANGTESWTFAWDSGTAPAHKALVLSARATSGNESRIAEILVTPVPLPENPLVIDHAPIEEATAARTLRISARITGDEPLSAALFYKHEGSDVYKRLSMERTGPLFTADVPALDVDEGTLRYYIEARSGLLALTSPQDALAPHVVRVEPAPPVGVTVEGPSRVAARAGAATTLDLTVTNVGATPATITLEASGLRASWATVPSERITLDAGASTIVPVALQVPALAFADNTTLRFRVADVEGIAAPSEVVVPVEILASADGVRPQDTDTTSKPTPGPAPLLAVALVALAAFASRRWRS